MNENTQSVKRNEPIRDRILASLAGGALGDALGYAVEFENWSQIRKEYGADGIRVLVLSDGKARFSDDTQMTLFTAEGCCLGYGRETTVRSIYQSYLCWLRTQGIPAVSRWDGESRLAALPEMNRRRAPGNTCLSALCSGKMGTPERPINHSKGCGGVMRTAPLGFVRGVRSGTNPFGKALRTGAEAAAITHGHPLGWIPAGILSEIVERCIYEEHGSLREIIELALASARETFGDLEEMAVMEALLRHATELAEEGSETAGSRRNADVAAIHSLGGGWVGEEALAIAVYAALRYENDLQECLIAAVNHEGDSDSTGAIAGNILGAYLGMRSVPQKWYAMLELTDRMEEIADTMARIAEEN